MSLSIPEPTVSVPPTSPAWSYSRVLHIAAAGICLTLLTLYLTGWYGFVLTSGGLEKTSRFTDFVATPTGALILVEGRGSMLYDLETQRATEYGLVHAYLVSDPGPQTGLTQMLAYLHPPFEAMIAVPFIRLPVSVVFVLWDLFMLGALVASLVILANTLPIARSALLVTVVAVLSYLPLLRSMILGQNAPLVLLGLCCMYASQRRGSSVWTGIGLVLIAFKPQILPLILLLLVLQRQWKPLLIFAGVYGALTVAAMLVLGPFWPLQYLQMLSKVADSPAVGVHPEIMHNWRGLAVNLFGAQSGAAITILTVLLSLASITVLVWAWAQSRVSSSSSLEPSVGVRQRKSRDLLWALSGLLAVPLSPHLNPHDLVLLIFPGWLMVTYATSGALGSGVSRLWITTLWVGYAIIPLTFYGTIGSSNSAVTVIPSVLVIAAAAALLLFATSGRIAFNISVATAKPNLVEYEAHG